jgi:hypothetical protein
MIDIETEPVSPVPDVGRRPQPVKPLVCGDELQELGQQEMEPSIPKNSRARWVLAAENARERKTALR